MPRKKKFSGTRTQHLAKKQMSMDEAAEEQTEDTVPPREIDFSKIDKEDVQKEVKAVVQAMVDTLAAKQVRQVRADWAFRQRFEAARIATAQYNALSYAVRALPTQLQAEACVKARRTWCEATGVLAREFPEEICMMCLESDTQCQCTNSCPVCCKQCPMREFLCLWEPGMCECFIMGAQEEVADDDNIPDLAGA